MFNEIECETVLKKTIIDAQHNDDNVQRYL